jgi:hypothetical protein
LGSYIAGTVGGMTALYLASGMSWDEIKKRLTPGLKNNKFLAYPIKVGDSTQEVGPGGIVLNLMSLATDIGRNANDPKAAADLSFQWLAQKFGPALSTAEAIRTGQNAYGQPQSRVASVMKNFSPIAASRVLQGGGSANLGAKAVSSAASFIGLNSKASSAINDVYELANAFMKDSGLRKETGWKMAPVDEASYTKLRAAVQAGSQSRFNEAYNDLLNTHTEREILNDMKQWKDRGFAGNSKNEHRFRVSLNDYETDLYSQAVSAKKDIYRNYRQMRLEVP